MKTIYKKLLIVLLLLPFTVLAQNTLSGNVKDLVSGQPIPGVNVIVQGTTNGATTDFDGNFSLSKLNKGDVIEVSFVGYKTTRITYNAQKTLEINLEEEATRLDEVVLIGYGTVKKKDVTGSVTLVTSKDFNQGANVTAENLLTGKVAGVTINTGGGAPGSGAEIRIRGGSSLNASNDPLIVIDGLPITSESGVGATSILSSINPNDIESFSVLKDASATAIYGSRASNGVIIITTKRGSKKLQVDYNFQYGSGKKINKIDVFSSQGYRDLILGTFDGDGNQVNPGIGTAAQIASIGDFNTDWQEEIFRRTDFVDNNISIKGELFKAIPTRLSYGNTYQEGLLLTNALTRNTISVNMSPSLFKDHLKFRLAANYTNQRNRFADVGAIGSALSFNPTKPVYDANSPYDGFFEYYTLNGNGVPVGANPSGANPVANLLQTYDIGKDDRIYGNFEIDYKFHFLPELRAVVNFGYDKTDGSRNRLKPKSAKTSFSNNNINLGTSFNEEKTLENKLLDTYLIYNKTFGDLVFEGTAGYSYQKFTKSGLTGIDFRDNTKTQQFYNDTPTVLIGFFGRGNFSFKDKYLLTLTYRRDGTSRFGPENRWGNFPAASFAWKIKEDLLKDSKVLSDLKLRIGWGITGQQNIDRASFYLPIYNQGNPNSQYVIGGVPLNVGIPEAYGPLKWEETSTYNAGLDYGFLNNRLTGSLDVFYKFSSDLLQIAPFADAANFSNQGPQNIGDMEVKGIEFSVNYDIIRNDKVKWNVNFNATKFERRINTIALGTPLQVGNQIGTGTYPQLHQQGFTPFSFFVYKQLYDTNGSPIEGAVADLNGDNVINDQDKYIYKNPDPDVVLGFSTSLNVNNFDISFNLRANMGNRVLNAYQALNSSYAQLTNGVSQNVSTNVLNTNFVLPNTEQRYITDQYVENASFLRMDFATVGYTFENWLDGKATVRLFSSVQNPFVVTKYSGLDPELNGGVDNVIYPRQRQFLFGANVKF